MEVEGRPGVYEGELVGGEPEGVGEFRWDDGERYQGEWRAGCYEGRGTTFHSNGSKRYEGEWRAGVREGRGTTFWSDGSKCYEGEYRAGCYEGRGTSFRRSGEVHKSGVWLQDRFLHE